MNTKLLRIMELINTPGALWAALRWPKFSLSAYQIITRAKMLGVLPKAVIDVGANIGQFSVAASKLFQLETIYPIEPDPQVAKKLGKNIGKLISKNIVISAIGAEVGERLFNVNLDSQVSSMLPLGVDRIKGYPGASVVEKITVPITTLDALFFEKFLPTPILLKIDVQGFEDQVIAGAKKFLTKVQWVLVEVSFATLYEGELDFDSITSLLEESGFRFVGPMNFHTSPTTREIIEMDALFESVNRVVK